MKVKILFLLLIFGIFPSIFGQDENIYIYHQAIDGETFRSVGKIYGVSESEIRDANPNLQWTLKADESVRIPYKKELVNNTFHQKSDKNIRPDTLFYEVSAKETLWGISRKFNISIDALIAANPVLKDGLKIGQKIIIPTEQPETIPEKIVATTVEQQTHTVKAGETMYSIAKMHRVRLDSLQLANPQIINNRISIGDTLNVPTYSNANDYIEHTTTNKEKVTEIAFNYQVPVQDIKDANPQISKTVSEGKMIKIPVPPLQEKETIKQETVVSQVMDTIKKAAENYCIGGWNTESVFKIALMIPFNAEQFNPSVIKNTTHKNAVSDYPFFQYIQFYQSTLLALEELQKNGLHFELFVYNVTTDNDNLKQIIESNTLKNMDLIIGIMYKDVYKKIADYAKEHGIMLVNVNSDRDEIVNNYPNVVKIMPCQEQISEAAASVLPDTLENFNLLIVCQQDSICIKENQILHAVLSNKYHVDTIKNSEYVNVKSYGVVKKLQKNKPNYVIVNSDNKAYIMDVMRILDKQKNNYEIHLIGYPGWAEINDLELSHIQNLNTVLITHYLVDYEDEFVIHFIRTFRECYNAEPDNWAFQGYDIVSFFVEGLAKFGKNFMSCSEHIEYRPMTTKFQFETSDNKGYTNQYWNIYTIKDFKIIRLD